MNRTPQPALDKMRISKMNSFLDRRTFMRLSSACAVLLSQKLHPQTKSTVLPLIDKSIVKNRKNFVGIQIRAYAWHDEGIDRLLDLVQEKGDVNTMLAYTFSYSREDARMKKSNPIPLPDHGSYGDPNEKFVGGAFYDYAPKFFQNTVLKDFRSPDFGGKVNVISDVAAKVKARGMDYFAWDFNNADPMMMRAIPNAEAVSEIDVYGRRTACPCWNNPDYRAFLIGKVETYLIQYANEVDGIMWGCERMGPLENMIGGGWETKGISCFCPYCRQKARERGISVERAQAGYQRLDQLFSAAAKDQRPSDGYFVSFWRLLLEYPEILAWNMLWYDSYHEVRSELYSTAKTLAPAKPFGFHIMHATSLNPFYRATEDWSKTKNYADFVKLANYNNAAGPRMQRTLDSMSGTIFHDAAPEDILPLYYKIMNYHEAPYDQLHIAGLSPDYVAEETKRAIAGVQGQTKIYPAIDIDVPTKLTDHRTKPEDVRQAVRAAMGAGADGVVLSREYVEMWIANIAAAGDTLREIFANSTT
jgi:hypothetical protein